MAETAVKRAEQAHDEKIAALYGQLAKAQQEIAYSVSELHSMAGHKQHYFGHQASSRAWACHNGSHYERVGLGEALSKLAGRENERALRAGKTIGEALALFEERKTAARAIESEIETLEEQYTGWSRFFLVTSSAGHIHSSLHCSSCRPTTTYGWLPEMSGQSEQEAVNAYGPALCSVCFSSAPVEWQGAKLSQAQAADILAGRTPRASVKKTYCTGSGRAPKASRGRYGLCPECGSTEAITMYGLIRKHAAKVAA